MTEARSETTRGSAQRGERRSTAERRHARQREIVTATRTLFDQRGIRDAHIDDIAREVGINRAIVYRHFSSKEEIFALALAEYLQELEAALALAAATEGSEADRLTATVDAFALYSLSHPAFIDCAQTLMGRTWPMLVSEVSELPLLHLGELMAACLGYLVDILEAGNATGEFHVDEPALLANTLYAAGLGALQLARVGIYISQGDGGGPLVRTVRAEQVRNYLVKTALAATR